MTFFAALAVSGCVDRKQADERLAAGCAAGVELYLEDTFKIKEIKNKSFGDSTEEATGFRTVTLDYIESDGWADVEKTARCTFAENFGFLNMSYGASIYQLRVNDQVYGKQGKEILGTYEDMLKLTKAVDSAMSKF